MIEPLKRKWENLPSLFKILIVIWMGYMFAFLCSGAYDLLILSSKERVKAIECRYIETIKNLGFPEQPELTEFTIDKFIGGKRVLINRFKYTLPEKDIIDYYEHHLQARGWQMVEKDFNKRLYEKDGMEFLLTFPAVNVYQLRLSMKGQ